VSRALQQQQRRHRAARRRRIQRLTLGWVLAALILLASGGLLADRLMDPAVFPIRELEFRGELEHVPTDALRERLAGIIEANYFGVDLERVERIVEAVDWVQRARVRRIWPDGLRVTIDEHHLVARWGNDAWLNDDGEVVELPAVEQPGVLRLAGPQGTSRAVFRRAAEWIPAMREAGLRLKALTLNERRAWYAVVARANGGGIFSVAVGRDSVADRFQRFLSAYRALSGDKASRIDHVDARYPNGIALRLQQPIEDEEPA